MKTFAYSNTFLILLSSVTLINSDFEPKQYSQYLRDCPRCKFRFLQNEECKQICIKNYSANDSDQQKLLKRLMKGSKLNYQQHWTVDNMPVTFCYKDDRIDSENCSYGFPIGNYITKSDLAKHLCYGNCDIYYVGNH
ncbi:unnamed protein product [Didymodactylos carnosus]|uniref:Transmembrane protein n=1 Tax=Didymodactylos carnosus TaxID=1234261 RepID=A0A814ZQK7_9BILA|nr:unnamed protein product [Didymodactylos carnosus]CAF1246136.1 unnamed protein product [Didymodactylos carnosus]CAF4012124.1 unnamed protein product [Didymodactylos carnosus]CAF4049306.1 unnamed protein product [Didymodactylos carnosus]